MPDVKAFILGDASSLKRAYKEAAAATQQFGRHAKTTTGHVAGLDKGLESASTSFRTFAKGALLAGGALVGVGSLYEGIKKTVSAAEDFNQGQRQLQAQLKANGESFKAVSPWVEKLSASQVQLGFTSTQTEQAFTQLDRASGSAASAYKYMAVTADLAAARHIDLNKAALVVGKVMDGNVGILNRYGVAVAKGTSAADALSQAQQKLQGQASASVTPFEKFHAVLNNIEVAIGQQLLPIVTKYLDKVTEWLSKADNQKRITDVVKTAIHDLTVVLTTAWGIFQDMLPTLEKVGRLGFLGVKTAIDVAKEAFAVFTAVFGKHKAEIIAGVVAIGVALTLALGPEAAAIVGAIVAVGYIRKHWGTLVAFFKTLGQEIGNALNFAWTEIQRGAVEAALGIVEPFSHLPGAMGKWARKAKDSMQLELDKLVPPNMDWSVAAKQAGVTAGDAWTKGFQGAAVTTAPGTTGPVGGGGGGGPIGTMGPLTGKTGAPMSVGQGQGFILAALKKRGWTSDQLAQVKRLMDYEDASGAPGDSGSSFGPRQLHAGGQLPNSVWAKGSAYAQQWAWSKPGLSYAAQGLMGFGGLHGSALANAIAAKQASSNIPKEAAAVLGGGGGLTTGPPGPTVLPNMTPVKSSASLKAAAQAAKNKLAAAAAKAAAKVIKDVHDDAVVALEGTPKLGVDVSKLQKAWAALATTIAKPFQTIAGKAATQVGYLQQLMGTEVPGRVTDYTTEITAQVNTQVKALEDGLAKLKAGGMGGTAAAAKITAALNTALTSQEGLLQNAVQAARSVYDSAVSKFTTSFGKLAQDIVSQFQAQTAAHITDLGAQFFQGSKTPAEAALSAMQAADTYTSLQDALNQAQESGDQKQIAMAQRALDEYNLSLDAVAERTKADQDYATAVKTYTDQRATQEQALTDSLNKFGVGVQNGKVSMDGLPALLKTFGLTLGTGPGNATAAVNVFAQDLKAATTDSGGIISSLEALQKAFDALVGWVNDKTGSNINSGAVDVGGGAAAGAAIGIGGGGGDGPAAGVAGGAAAYYQPINYTTPGGTGNYAKKPMLAGGGVISRSGLAFVHAGETVVPAGKGGGATIHINVQGYVGDENRLTDMVLSGLRREKTRLATLGLT